MKLFKISLFVSVVTLIAGCGLIQKLTCNTSNAARSAQEDVKNGQTSQPGKAKGDSCEGEYTKQHYKEDYQRAYSQAVIDTCTAANAVTAGQADGLDGSTTKNRWKQFLSCEKSSLIKQFENSYNAEFTKAFCSEGRAVKLATEVDAKLEVMNFDAVFGTCPGNKNALKTTYEKSYQSSYDKAMIDKTNQFVQSTGTSNFNFAGRPYSASCRVASDKSNITVVVNNPHPQQALVQGVWKHTYYDKSFNRILEDTSAEALMLSQANPKSFIKMTMPRDTQFCRSEFTMQ